MEDKPEFVPSQEEIDDTIGRSPEGNVLLPVGVTALFFVGVAVLVIVLMH